MLDWLVLHWSKEQLERLGSIQGLKRVTAEDVKDTFLTCFLEAQTRGTKPEQNAFFRSSRQFDFVDNRKSIIRKANKDYTCKVSRSASWFELIRHILFPGVHVWIETEGVINNKIDRLLLN
jgi:hypothetical protein